MSLAVTLTAKAKINQVGSNDAGGPTFNPTIQKVIDLIDGTAADKADLLFYDERTIAASGNESLDLAGSLADAFGATITMVELVALLIIADAGNTNNVVIGDATNPIALFGGTNPTHAIKPGGFAFFAAPPDGGLVGTIGAGSTDELKVANSGSGTGVTYQILAVGRSA